MKKILSTAFIIVSSMALCSCAMFFSKNTVEIVMQPEPRPPAAARIYIDGDLRGSYYAGMDAPKYNLSCRKHKFEIRAEGYVDWQKEVIILDGKPHRLTALLVKESGKK